MPVDPGGRDSYISPQTGFEPVTNRLTADRSTTELLRIKFYQDIYFEYSKEVHCRLELVLRGLKKTYLNLSPAWSIVE